LFAEPTKIEPEVPTEETQDEIVAPPAEEEVGMLKSRFKFGQKKELPIIPKTDDECK